MQTTIINCCGVLLILLVIAWIKNDNTYKNRIIIFKAIESYNLKIDYLIKIGDLEDSYQNYISFNCAEPYIKTLFRWYDWGYENIVPPDVLAVIKSHIKK